MKTYRVEVFDIDQSSLEVQRNVLETDLATVVPALLYDNGAHCLTITDEE